MNGSSQLIRQAGTGLFVLGLLAIGACQGDEGVHVVIRALPEHWSLQRPYDWIAVEASADQGANLGRACLFAKETHPYALQPAVDRGCADYQTIAHGDEFNFDQWGFYDATPRAVNFLFAEDSEVNITANAGFGNLSSLLTAAATATAERGLAEQQLTLANPAPTFLGSPDTCDWELGDKSLRGNDIQCLPFTNFRAQDTPLDCALTATSPLFDELFDSEHNTKGVFCHADGSARFNDAIMALAGCDNPLLWMSANLWVGTPKLTITITGHFSRCDPSNEEPGGWLDCASLSADCVPQPTWVTVYPPGPPDVPPVHPDEDSRSSSLACLPPTVGPITVKRTVNAPPKKTGGGTAGAIRLAIQQEALPNDPDQCFLVIYGIHVGSVDEE